jgi:transcription initiation factor TFIID subunit 5
MIGHNASIYSLAFSAESSLLVSGSADWTVRCWDVKNAGGNKSGKPRENGILGAQENGITSYGEDEASET